MDLFGLGRRLGAWRSCMVSGRVRGPDAVLLDERVGEDQEFPHHRCKGDLRRFPVGHESLVRPLEVGIVPDRDQRGHVEQSAHMVPATLNEAASLPGAGLPSHRGESGEAGGTGPGESAQFGHMDERSCGGDVRDAGDGGQDVGLALQGLLFPEPFPDLGVDALQLALDLPQPLLVELLGHGGAEVLAAVGDGDPVLDQRIADQLEFGKVALPFGLRLSRAPFIDAWKGGRPSRLVLDIDSTDDEVHGRQEGGFYHGYYNHYCFLPLYITCGGRPLFALLRPGNADPAGGVTGPLGRIVERLRQRWPGLEILLRADSAYAREEILAWCEDNGVDYVTGLARNSRLVETIGWELADAQAEAKRRGRPARRFAEFPYATLTSWSRKRRVVAKAEHLPGKSNPRFVVTSLPDTFSARTVYERVYCPRGNMENAIKEQQLDLFSDRTSASRFAANQLRLLFSAFASILFDALRRALHGTPLARATAGTLRLKLLKIGARVTVSIRRLKVAMDSAHPSATAFARVHARLPG